MATVILGISAFYHDSAAALIIDGEIMAAAQEERFTRIKHDPGFPENAIKYVLEDVGIAYHELTAIAFYDKPMLKFERLLETYHAFAPKGLISFIKAMPVWLNEKLLMKKLLRKHLKPFGNSKIPVLFPEHHLSHAASAYYPSPYNDAAILTVDGVGEWATATISHGKGNQITILKELHFPHSIGLLYSAFTYYLGFEVNEGEYKLMGLAPYGDPECTQTLNYKQKILLELVDLREDGSIILNMPYFDFATKLTMTNDKKWEALFDLPRRRPESVINKSHMNLALAIQQVTEIIVTKLANTAQKLTQSKNLVLAGGVALNCVANSKIAKTKIFENIWIQPAAGDAGGSLGAGLAACHIWAGLERCKPRHADGMKNAYLGPQYDDRQILNVLRKYNAPYKYYENFEELTDFIGKEIADGGVIGWFQGRMEFGPRALGNRSILGDPTNPVMQQIINLKIKAREEFRPFAPSVVEEDADKFFEMASASPYMLFVGNVKPEHLKELPANYRDMDLYSRLYFNRSSFQSITHVDNSARLQTVSQEANPRFWQLLKSYKRITGYGMLINTSFNVRGEPIVCTPHDAYHDFIRTEMDCLVLGNFILSKNDKPDA